MTLHEFFFGSGDYVQAFLGALMGVAGGLQALSGFLGARSASKARGKAEDLQRQQIEAAQQFQQRAQEGYDQRDPLRQQFMASLMGFRGSPQNPFAAEIFGPPPGPAPGMGAPPMMGAPRPAMQPGMPGAFNPYPQFGAGPGQNLIQSQIQPQFDRSALDTLRGLLGAGGNG